MDFSFVVILVWLLNGSNTGALTINGATDVDDCIRKGSAFVEKNHDAITEELDKGYEAHLVCMPINIAPAFVLKKSAVVTPEQAVKPRKLT